NHPRTSWKSLSQATIPLPPLSEQREIARILRSVDEHIEAEELSTRQNVGPPL
ncbi:restriction endonuclease subunit S, partial [Klebsiella pneumoniae]